MRRRAVLGVALFSLLGAGSPPNLAYGADPVYTSWRLAGPPQAKDLFQPSEMQSRGHITITQLQADGLGGVIQLTAKSATQCPTGAGLPQGGELQRFRFTWKFDADVSRISASRGPMTVWFTIEGDRGTGCMDQNPYMQLYVDGDPIAYVDQRTNYGFYFKPISPPHVAGPRTFNVTRKESWRKDAFIKIVIADFRHAPYRFQFETTYTYVGESAGAGPVVPPTDLYARDLIARAGRDGRFGGAIAGSAGAQLNWAPAWQLRWLDFQFSGGRVVRIYHATSTANPAIRYTIYVDPDTGQWRNWEQAS